MNIPVPALALVRRCLPAVVAGLLVAAFLVQARLAARLGITYDETFYLSTSQEIFRRGSLKGCTTVGIAPLPLYLLYWLPACFDDADRSGWDAHLGDPGLIHLARWLAALVVGVPLVLLVFAWLYRRGGLLPATLGGAFLVFSPSVLAHASLATTDACFALTALLTLAFLCGYRDHPSWLRLVLLSLAFALALLSKYSAMFLLPVIALVFLRQTVIARRPYGGWWRWLLGVAGSVTLRLGVLGGLAFLVGWTAFLWQWAPLFPSPPSDSSATSRLLMRLGGEERGRAMLHFVQTARVPAILASMEWQRKAATNRGYSYLCGKVSGTGFRAYYAVASAVKSTPAELGLAVLAGAALLWRLFTKPGTLAAASTPWLWFGSGMLLFVLMTFSKKQLGIRYILPLYPLLFLYSADLLTEMKRPGRTVLAVVLTGLLGGQVFSAVSIQPQYLAYFNSLAGGPANGHRYLIGSDLDWGQDLPLLKSYMQDTGRHRVVLAYFGTALPDAYDIDAVDWKKWPQEGGEADRFVLSVNSLCQSSATNTQWVSFAALEPAEHVGWSLWLYDLANPAVQDALREAQRFHQERYP